MSPILPWRDRRLAIHHSLLRADHPAAADAGGRIEADIRRAAQARPVTLALLRQSAGR